jgi:hypothetical protein
MKITLEKSKALSIRLCPSNKRYLKKNEKPCKLGERTSGPYKVLQTHVIGTLELRPGVSEKLKIGRVIPYKEPTPTSSEVQSKMIFMGHQISSGHVPVVRSFFIL